MMLEDSTRTLRYQRLEVVLEVVTSTRMVRQTLSQVYFLWLPPQRRLSSESFTNDVFGDVVTNDTISIIVLQEQPPWPISSTEVSVLVERQLNQLRTMKWFHSLVVTARLFATSLNNQCACIFLRVHLKARSYANCAHVLDHFQSSQCSYDAPNPNDAIRERSGMSISRAIDIRSFCALASEASIDP